MAECGIPWLPTRASRRYVDLFLRGPFSCQVWGKDSGPARPPEKDLEGGLRRHLSQTEGESTKSHPCCQHRRSQAEEPDLTHLLRGENFREIGTLHWGMHRQVHQRENMQALSGINIHNLDMSKGNLYSQIELVCGGGFLALPLMSNLGSPGSQWRLWCSLTISTLMFLGWEGAWSEAQEFNSTERSSFGNARCQGEDPKLDPSLWVPFFRNLGWFQWQTFWATWWFFSYCALNSFSYVLNSPLVSPWNPRPPPSSPIKAESQVCEHASTLPHHCVVPGVLCNFQVLQVTSLCTFKVSWPLLPKDILQSYW